MNDPRNTSSGDLKDRMEGLEFSLEFARGLAAVSPEREDLQERISQLEAELDELKKQMRSQTEQ